MKKRYLWLAVLSWHANSQTLNQSAGWPNPAWTITGNYVATADAFESDPRTTANFAYDDYVSGNPHEDNIAAESPVIDLRPAFAAGETILEITAQYSYRNRINDVDVLRFEYWDAAIAAWLPWDINNIPPNGNTSFVIDNFCVLPKTTYLSENLSIAGFTPAQLAGFRYRIFYDDDLAEGDWNYGFCFSSPTLRSWSCGAPNRLTVTGVGSSPIVWDGVAGAGGYEYVLNTISADPTGAGTPTISNIFLPSGLPLPPSTKHYFHVRSVCTASQSPWRTVSFVTSPANDDCTAAIVLTVNATSACTVKTAGTLESATDSDEPHVGMGTPDDDVWYKFVATATSHRIELSNITGNGGEIIVHEVLEGTCGGGLISVHLSDPDLNPTSSSVRGLTVGNTYFIRVFTYGSDANTATDFDICISTPPPPPANDNCSGAYTLTVNPTATCTAVTAGNLTSATDSNEGDNGIGTPNDDVWFKFVATQTAHRVSLRNITGMPRELVIEILKGNCGGGLTSLKITDSNSCTAIGLTIGNTYYVRVFSDSPDTGATTGFNVCLSVPPVGALCEKPIVITSLPYTTTDNTILYGDDYDFPEGGESGCADTSNHYLGGDEAVYAYTPTVNQTVNIRIPGAPGWTAILVYTDCEAIGTGAVACASGEFEIEDREINGFSMTAGTTYYILLSTQPAPQSFSYTLNVTPNLSTEPFEESGFKAYPNPVKDKLQLSYTEEMSHVVLFNVLGQQVLSKKINATESQIDMSDIPSGTYLVKAYSNDQTKTLKVIKQ